MQVQTHFTFQNEHEFAEFCKHFGTFLLPPTSNAKKDAVPSDNLSNLEAGRAALAAARATKAAAKAAKAKEEEDDEDQDDDSSEAVTFTDVKQAVIKVADTKGREVACEMLDKFGYKKINADVKESDYDAIVKACEAILAA